jgi:hypothetical protein
VTIEGSTPQVVSVTASPKTGDLDAGKTVTITLTTNEAVKVIGSPSLALNDCGTATYESAQSTSTSLVFEYTVAAGQNTSDLSITSIILPKGSAITDPAGDNADLSAAFVPLGLQIDTTPPTVDAVVTSLRNVEVTTGHPLSITLDMSAPVSVAGSPELLLDGGGIATYSNASSSSTALTFDYTASYGQETPNLKIAGIELASNSAIEDGAGNPANLSGAGANLQLGVNTKYSPSSAPNTGSYTIAGTSELELFGASEANLTFGAGSTGTLELDDPSQFSGTVAGLALGNYIDLSGLAYLGNNSPAFHSTGNNTGTLAVTEGASTINIALLGNYLASSFVASSDGHGGTLVTDPHLTQQPLLGQPLHA